MQSHTCTFSAPVTLDPTLPEEAYRVPGTTVPSLWRISPPPLSCKLKACCKYHFCPVTYCFSPLSATLAHLSHRQKWGVLL